MYFKPEEAIRRALNMAGEGADIIDLGAESTRPGAEPIQWEEEWSRLEPVLQGLSPRIRGVSPQFPLVSVDTYHPETAERAIAAGAGMVNCVYAKTVSEMFEICAKNATKLVVPASCCLGTVPKSIGSVPKCAGSVPTYLDPMVGFGTTREEDLELLRSVPELAKRGPVLVGASRKRIVKKLTGEKVTGKNLGGNLGIAVWCALHGASIVRVHDVRETVQAIKVVSALEGD